MTKSFQEKFAESLGLKKESMSIEEATDCNSKLNESFVEKFRRSIEEMNFEKSGKKVKKRKRSEDSGLDSSDYFEATSEEQSGKIGKSKEVETSLEASDGKRKKRKMGKGETENGKENPPDVELDQPPEDTGSITEKRQASHSKEKLQKKKTLLSNKDSEEMFQESAEEPDKTSELPIKKKKKKEKRKETGQEEVREAPAVTENDQDLPIMNMVEMKSETLEEVEGETSRTEGPQTIKEFYRMPKKSKVSAEIYSACKFIMEQQVAVSLLNRVYTGHCVPRERTTRKELRRKYNARFGGHSVEQDEMILRRFKEIVSHLGVEGSAREFIQSVLETTSGKNKAELHKSKFRTIGVRNIIGLYVGQDIPNRIAFIHFNRLVKLALKTSPLSKYVPVTTAKKFTRVQWTAEEHFLLLRLVLKDHISVDQPENISVETVDWKSIAATNQFGDRTGKNLREQFQRTLYPALVDEMDATSILHYRRDLLTAIRQQGARSRQDIDWGRLQDSFWPKTKAILQQNFNNLTKGGRESYRITSFEEFDSRLTTALQKIERHLGWPEEQLEKFMRNEVKKDFKIGLREQFYSFAAESKPCRS